MSFPPDDADSELLISRLAGPLDPVDRVAFRRAAQAAIGQLSCSGPGIAYRVVSDLWRSYFRPPSDLSTSWDIAQELPRSSKLVDLPCIGADDPRTGGRDRRRLKVV